MKVTTLCPVCGTRSFKTKSSFNVHLKSHSEGRFFCDSCGKLFSSATSFFHQLNELERQFACVKNQALRYFLMIKELANKKHCDK